MTHSQANRLMFLAAILWGGGNVAQQTVLEHIGPFLAVGLRCLIASAVILPFTSHRKVRLALSQGANRMLGFQTILAFAAAMTFSQIGYGLTTVTNAGFMVNTTTVITPIIAWALLLQRPPAIVWLSAMLIIVGAGLMSGASMTGFNLGDAMCLVAAVSYAFWMILLGKFAQSSDDVYTLTQIQFLFAGLLCLVFGLLVEPVSVPQLQAALPELLVLGVLSTGAAYMLQAIAQRYTSASEAAIIGSGEAVIGAMAAYIVLGERLTALGATGAAMVFTGILLVQLPALVRDRRRQPAPYLAMIDEPGHRLSTDRPTATVHTFPARQVYGPVQRQSATTPHRTASRIQGE